MTNHPYPPLPDEEVYCDACSGFSAAQMRAYVDADREQCKPLTDEQILDEASHWGFLGNRIQLLRFVRALEGINPPPRPDAGNN